MDKKVFLAIGLSMMVVWLWSAISPQPAHVPTEQISSQIANNKELGTSSDETPTPFSPLVHEIEGKETKIVISEKLKAEFSNIGGLLEKIDITEYNASLPINRIVNLNGYESLPFTLISSNERSIRYFYENDEIRVDKTYSLSENDYIIEAGIVVSNKSDMSKLIDIDIGNYVIEAASLDINGKDINISKTNSHDKSLLEYTVYTEKEIYRKSGAFKFSPKEKKEDFGKVYWSGFRDRYFCALIKPLYESTGYSILPVGDKELHVSTGAGKITIAAGDNIKLDTVIYVGPEEMDILKSYTMGFEKIKKYYRFGLLDGIAKIISSMMHVIYKFIPNWGVCIMLISCIIYFSMYPLTMRGMMSMKKMQSLQPMIAKLKEKHKDSPQKMNKEMMELYKENKVNPLGGCLPMLLQMPVFIGLYQVLWRSVSFKGAHFLWIKDLSQPDRLFIMPFSLPFLGNEFNLLPVVMIVVMFFQQKITSKNMVVTDPSQAAQQKMMTTIMPVFLGFIFYKFASGLTLYFTMFYMFSTFSQWKMSKVTKGVDL